MPAATDVSPSGNYGVTRFNALRHGVVSRYTVLPWKDEAEYQTLLSALAEEHAPEGPTEEHLVEELAGIIWRKRRIRMAEAAVYREKIRHDAEAYGGADHIAGAALLPVTGKAAGKASVAQAIATTPSDTARDLRELKRDRGMTRRAWDILVTGGSGAYERALAALGGDTRAGWEECLAESPDDGLVYAPTAEALRAWIDRYWKEWHEQPIAELQHRDTIRDQALGIAYATDDLEVPVRYEVHLDRKFERTLAMLIRLRDLRRTAVPG
jgi:hypothetical protein